MINSATLALALCTRMLNVIVAENKKNNNSDLESTVQVNGLHAHLFIYSFKGFKVFKVANNFIAIINTCMYITAVFLIT
jgi:hypothetical protein